MPSPSLQSWFNDNNDDGFLEILIDKPRFVGENCIDLHAALEIISESGAKMVRKPGYHVLNGIQDKNGRGLDGRTAIDFRELLLICLRSSSKWSWQCISLLHQEETQWSTNPEESWRYHITRRWGPLYCVNPVVVDPFLEYKETYLQVTNCLISRETFLRLYKLHDFQNGNSMCGQQWAALFFFLLLLEVPPPSKTHLIHLSTACSIRCPLRSLL